MHLPLSLYSVIPPRIKPHQAFCPFFPVRSALPLFHPVPFHRLPVYRSGRLSDCQNLLSFPQAVPLPNPLCCRANRIALLFQERATVLVRLFSTGIRESEFFDRIPWKRSPCPGSCIQNFLCQ